MATLGNTSNNTEIYNKSEVDSGFLSTTAAADKADLVAGKVPQSQLPSYVDDVEEYADLASFPGTGEAGKIYMALDTNKIYRWATSVYVEISDAPDASEVKTLYESNANTNAFTDAEKTNLGNQSGTNTGDEVQATESVKGIAEIATQAEVDAGTDDTRMVTPLKLSNVSSAAQGARKGMQWTFSTTTTDADPGAGNFRFNNATQGSATFIYIDNASFSGVNMSTVIQNLVSGDRIYIQGSATNRYHLVRITGTPTDGTGYWKIPIAVENSGTSIQNNAKCGLIFFEVGDRSSSSAPKVVQIKRTSIYTITSTPTNITFDTTDVESDSAVVEHDSVNTERIILHDSAYYYGALNFDFIHDGVPATDRVVTIELRRNDTTTLSSIDINITAGSTESVCKTLVISPLTAGDYLTIRLSVDTGTDVDLRLNARANIFKM